MSRSFFAGCAVVGIAVAGLPLPALATGEAASASTAVSAGAAVSAGTAACAVTLGSVTAGGDVERTTVVATSPPTVQHAGDPDQGVFPAGQVRLGGSIVINPDLPEPYSASVYGGQVLGGSMYNTSYNLDAGGNVDPATVRRTLVGGGWASFTAFDTTRFYPATPTGGEYHHQYALRSDGVLFRWEDGKNTSWANKQSAAGFAAVKSMTLISQTKTYETFLANTRGGALYTIRLPLSSPLKPVVKLVRRSTWQNFDSLVARRCGQYGVVLLGIDKDTGQGYLYAVGHANGTSTVIKGLGKVQSTFTDPVYFRASAIPGSEPQPFGE
ncbi:hypothetical protein [Kribbella shirazensis]|uniref:Secreted protein n=1 Tax=Kribbella shirazensis TaxID=1105143 RepID=A0A7X5V7L8_9ACTN|nr:hypothetical protein [Kribbella shirazensis]NIK56110.1 hypothetical protein [Kribbella shirazensis]